MNTDRPRILKKLAIASFLKVHEKWNFFIQSDPNTVERMSWVKFEDSGEMRDDAQRCWLRTCWLDMYVEWERIFERVRKALYDTDIIDRNGYAIKPLDKTVMEFIKVSFAPKRKVLEEDRVYASDWVFPDEDSVDLMDDFEEDGHACFR